MAKAGAAHKLAPYRAKRDFAKTAEPSGNAARKAPKAGAGGIFVIHKHAARRLHYDLRLEHDGVLWSWAVTRGPSLDPDDKRLAVHVEDHPLDYGTFEGTIPAGEYGAGAVIVWDRGRWVPEIDPARGMAKGHLNFALEGEKLKGAWHLVRLRRRPGDAKDNWLLIKAKDEAASDRDILAEEPASVDSGRTIEDVEKGMPPKPAGASKAAAKSAKLAASARVAKPAKPARAKAAAKALAFIPPCLASLRSEPPEGADWVHEVKFDGYRMQAHLSGGKARLLTRTGLDWTARFGTTLADAVAALPCEDAILDGEIVALDPSGVSSFAALQQALSEGERQDLVLYAFDLLRLDGEDLTAEPLLARKERLHHLIGDSTDGVLRYSEHFEAAGDIMLAHACRMGLEGVISKRADAPYRSGRGGDWLKAKCTRSQEFAILGYVPSTARRDGIASLVVGFREGSEWRHAGRVGTGYTATLARDLKRKLEPLKVDRAPFTGQAVRDRQVVWVEPVLAAEVEYRTWTAEGLLRQAAFKGLREDKPVTEIVREEPKASGTRGSKSSQSKARDRKPAAPAIAHASLTLSNPDKVLWPDAGVTKAGLLAHYEAVFHRMASLVVNRPLSLLRAPDGIARHTFFQKNASPGMGEAVHILKARKGEGLLYVEDIEGIAALVQLGVVEIHTWGAMIEDVEHPDQVIFDLDPGEGVGLDAVRRGALAVRDRLAEIGLASFPKLSGGKGFHVTVPLVPQAGWDEVKTFARDFARAMAATEPKAYTATLAKKARRGKIFIDYLRNGRGATAVCAYSTRARKGAPFAVPISWKEVEDGIAPNAFTVGTALPAKDPWAGFREAAQPLNSR
jgi:bifunctional non-homologous end joining protein LigD